MCVCVKTMQALRVREQYNNYSNEQAVRLLRCCQRGEFAELGGPQLQSSNNRCCYCVALQRRECILSFFFLCGSWFADKKLKLNKNTAFSLCKPLLILLQSVVFTSYDISQRNVYIFL